MDLEKEVRREDINRSGMSFRKKGSEIIINF